MRSSASLAASEVPARALFSATISTVFPVEGSHVDPSVHVADLDPPAGRQLIGLPPLRGLARLQIRGDDVAARDRDEQDGQERDGDRRRR